MSDLLRDNMDQRVKAARSIIDAHHGELSGSKVAEKYSQAIFDAIRQHVLDIVAQKPEYEKLSQSIVLLAVGGFGRFELNLYSDIDLLFLLKVEPDENFEAFLKDVLYPFWEVKLDPSYMVKDIPQILEELNQDVNLATTLMSSQRLWGNEKLHDQLRTDLRVAITLKHGDALTDKVLHFKKARYKAYANTSAHLEPSVKEAPGGLRDIHTLYWLSYLHFGGWKFQMLVEKGILLHRDRQQIEEALDFLLTLRNEIHLHTGRKNDRLSVEIQIKIAPKLGFVSTDYSLPEEQLMRRYYEQTEMVIRQLRRVIKAVQEFRVEDRQTGRHSRMRGTRIEGHFWHRDGEIWLDAKEVPTITRDSSWMMHLFTAATMHDLLPTEATIDVISNHTHQVDKDFRLSAINRERFLMILKHQKNSGLAIRAMHESRFLENYIPEFKEIRHLPRIDYYHQFTVDEHLIRAVECCNHLFDHEHPMYDSHCGMVAREILRIDLLNFAILIHDIGKGEGRGHVIRGAHMVQRICQRLHMREKETEIIHDLVASHHKLSTVTLMRNAEDPGVPQQLARDIKSPELFKMLYVLTCCDLQSVSDESWNDWRGTLLSQMYARTMNYLLPQRDFRATDELLYVKLPELLEDGDEVIPHFSEFSEREKIQSAKDFILDMPERYRQSTPPEQIARHMKMAEQLCDERSIIIELEMTEESNYSILHIVTHDSPSLFQSLCGALASKSISIQSAQIYTAKTGLAVDVFQIQDQRGRPPSSLDLFERLEIQLQKILSEEKEFNWVIPPLKKANPISNDRLNLRPPNVTIFNEGSSEHYSILDIRAPDKAGLLYHVARILEKYRIHVHIALVATESYQIIDVFYVTDWDNNRLMPNPQTEALRQELLEFISPNTIQKN